VSRSGLQRASVASLVDDWGDGKAIGFFFQLETLATIEFIVNAFPVSTRGWRHIPLTAGELLTITGL
jgi:hypothetical protein